MNIKFKGNPTIEHFYDVAKKVNISKKNATDVIEDIQKKINDNKDI